MSSCLVSTMKNEGPHLLEWVAWHRLVGFDRIIVAQNDSTDGTGAILRVLEDIGAVTFIENSDLRPDGKALSYQGRAYRRAAKTEAYGECDWAIALDGDEFLWVATPGGTVADLIAVVGASKIDQVHVNWRSFGSAGLRRFTPDPICATFTECAPAERVAKSPASFKTMYRTAAFDGPGIHRPIPHRITSHRVVTGSGLVPPSDSLTISASTDLGQHRLAQVNHYRVRDAESFLVAKARGRANPNSVNSENLIYWMRGDAMGAEDRRLADQAPRIAAEMAALDAMSGGRLGRLTADAAAAWRALIDILRADPEKEAFYQSVLELQEKLRGPERGATMKALRESPDFFGAGGSRDAPGGTERMPARKTPGRRACRGVS